MDFKNLNETLLKIDPDFRAFVESMPDSYWAKYDLSACRIGWEAHKIFTQKSTSMFLTGVIHGARPDYCPATEHHCHVIEQVTPGGPFTGCTQCGFPVA